MHLFPGRAHHPLARLTIFAILALACGALLAPYLLTNATADARPNIRIVGGTSLELGREYTIQGSGFPGEARIVFRLDSRYYGWLPRIRTTPGGEFTATFSVKRIHEGSYELSAHERHPETGVKSPTLASLDVTVGTAPAPSARPHATATPQPTIGTPATPAARSTPTPVPATPGPTTAPTAAPTASTPGRTTLGSSAIVGYGANTVGGAGGRTISVTTLADSGPGSLREALAASGPRVITFGVAGVIDLESPIRVTEPFVTIAGQTAPSPGIQIRGETLNIGAHDVIVTHMRFRPGDATADNPGDADGLTINGGGGAAYNIVLDHVEAIWGPDVGGLAILNDVHDVTVQHSILGEGLLRSRHPESHDSDGHGMAVNVVGLDSSHFPSRVTFYRNLITTSEGRNPRVEGALGVDFVNNVIYNFATSPQGNPQALNMVNNILRTGPAPAAAGLNQQTSLWRPAPSGDFPSLFSGSVYLAGNVADGFTAATDAGISILAGQPSTALSVTPEPTAGLLDRVLAEVGPRLPTVDAVTARLLDNLRNRTGTYVNGEGEQGPNPSWP